jgi:hypothetical protein
MFRAKKEGNIITADAHRTMSKDNNNNRREYVAIEIWMTQIFVTMGSYDI